MAKQKKSSSKTMSKTSTNKRQSRSTQTPKQSSSHDSMKTEIANELGVTLGADATARENGSVGGEMTKRLVSKKTKKTSRKKK